MSMWGISDAVRNRQVPGILLDRDGTIIEDYHYVGRVERVQFKPGAIEAIRRFNEAGIPVAIITNQSGVARGFYHEADVYRIHEYIFRQLAEHEAYVDTVLFSPHHPDGNIPAYVRDTPFHKPKPGMAFRAASILSLDLSRSFVVGDRPEDVQLAHAIGATAIYLGDKQLPQYVGDESIDIRFFHSLADAAGYIIERITTVPQSEFPTMHYTGPIAYFTHYADEIKSVLDRVKHDALARTADSLRYMYETGRVFVAGNGGAATIAAHFQVDHLKGISTEEIICPSITCLNSDTALLTALSNDIGYDAVFSWQLEHLANRGDLLVVFSVSGNSPNIVRALQAATELGMASIAIVGCDGGQAAKIAGDVIHIPSSNYGVVEDIMSIIQHSLAQFIRQTPMSDDQIRSARF